MVEHQEPLLQSSCSELQVLRWTQDNRPLDVRILDSWLRCVSRVPIGYDRPSAKHSLDRKKNDLGYVPDNLRWALPVQQNNTRKNKPAKVSQDTRFHVRGSAHGSAKLTEDLVRQIRAEFASGSASTTELGLKYGLHRNTVNRVIQRVSRGGWSHVA